MRVSRCRSCGFRINWTLAGRSADAGEGYEAIDMSAYDRSLGAQRTAESGELLALATRYVPSGGAWLDVGCGIGVMLAAAAASGFTPTGIEPDPIARARAASLSRALIVERYEDLPAGRTFDVISALDVVEHLPPLRVRDEVRRIRGSLAPDRIFMVKVPSSEGVMFRAIELLYRLLPRPFSAFVNRLWLTRYASPHTMYFNRASLESLLRGAGFDVLTTRYVEAISLRGVYHRLRLDSTISRISAVFAVPAIVACSLVQKITRKTDAIVVVARRTA